MIGTSAVRNVVICGHLGHSPTRTHAPPFAVPETPPLRRRRRGPKGDAVKQVHDSPPRLSTPHFPAAPRPLPEAAGNLDRQPESALTGDHHDLSPMMRFVCNEIGKNVSDVE